ncbi:MAG: iron-containing alcohol dehydrogenase [Syntrophomonadaceae bacterium]|nr:iron-containing alcohol dehydrogenase [Syntrophomonadaceae bacterium]
MLPSYFEYYNPVKIISGHKSLENAPYELKRLYLVYFTLSSNR